MNLVNFYSTKSHQNGKRISGKFIFKNHYFKLFHKVKIFAKFFFEMNKIFFDVAFLENITCFKSLSNSISMIYWKMCTGKYMNCIKYISMHHKSKHAVFITHLKTASLSKIIISNLIIHEFWYRWKTIIKPIKAEIENIKIFRMVSKNW